MTGRPQNAEYLYPAEASGPDRSIRLRRAAACSMRTLIKIIMIHTVSIHIRPDDRKSLPFIRELIRFLDARGIAVLLPEVPILRESGLSGMIADGNRIISDPDLVVVVGGDGTFLRAARAYADTNTPIFGINRGRLGFLTEFSPEESLHYLDSVIRGEYTVSARAMLEALLIRGGDEIVRISFINDAVISKGAFSRPIMIRLELDHQFLNCYSGDGLIISTATGSTAYSLSAGGPIVVPTIDNVFIVNPICPHTLAMRPMILPSASALRARIISHFENLLLTIDGQEAILIEGDDEIIIRSSDKKIYLVPHPGRDYFDILHQKLGWGRSLNE